MRLSGATVGDFKYPLGGSRIGEGVKVPDAFEHHSLGTKGKIMTKSNIISIKAKTSATIVRKYDGNKYNAERLNACAQALTQSLGTYRQTANAFVRQVVFAILSDNQAEAFDTLIKRIETDFNPEIKRLVVAGCKHFKGCLPVQSELDGIDFFKLLVPAKKAEKKESEHGKAAVLAFIKDRVNKLNKSKKDYASEEADAWTVCLNALEDSLKK